MARTGWRHRTIVAMIAILAPAGALAAATVGAGAPAGDQRVGAAGLAQTGVIDEEATAPATTQLVASTTVVLRPAMPAPPAPPAPTTTVSRPGPTTTVTAPPVVMRPTVTLPPIPPASSWAVEANGVSVRMSMEPALPIAGQAVRFIIDVSSTGPCCTVLFDFGDGSEPFSWNNEPRRCDTPSSLVAGARRTMASHVYATPGGYRASVGVMAGDLCHQPPAPAPPDLHPAALLTCISVGPGGGGAHSCPPPPLVGP